MQAENFSKKAAPLRRADAFGNARCIRIFVEWLRYHFEFAPVSPGLKQRSTFRSSLWDLEVCPIYMIDANVFGGRGGGTSGPMQEKPFVTRLVLANAVPLALFAWLEWGAEERIYWLVPHTHAVMTLAVSGMAGILALTVAWVGVRLRNLQAVLLALSFVSLAGFLGMHGVLTPYGTERGAVFFDLPIHAGLLSSAFFLWLSSVPGGRRAAAYVERWQVLLVTGWVAIIVVGVAVAGFYPFGESTWETARAVAPWVWMASGAGALLSLTAAYNYAQAYRFAQLPFQRVLVFGAAWLTTCRVMAALTDAWSAGWWLYHFMLAAAALLAVGGLLRQFVLGESLQDSLKGLFVSDPLDRLARGLSGGVAQLIETMERKDPYIAGHTLRVARLSVRIGEQMGLTPRQLRALAQGALLHDLGKLHIPPEIVNKRGPLTDEEKSVINRHPELGYKLAASLGTLAEELEVILYHHERWDGTGYPRGLRGEEIPLLARILAVADVYDALTSDRSYRAAWTVEAACDYLRQEANRHFDPACVEAFFGQQTSAVEEPAAARARRPVPTA